MGWKATGHRAPARNRVRYLFGSWPAIGKQWTDLRRPRRACVVRSFRRWAALAERCEERKRDTRSPESRCGLFHRGQQERTVDRETAGRADATALWRRPDYHQDVHADGRTRAKWRLRGVSES